MAQHPTSTNPVSLLEHMQPMMLGANARLLALIIATYARGDGHCPLTAAQLMELADIRHRGTFTNAIDVLIRRGLITMHVPGFYYAERQYRVVPVSTAGGGHGQ